MEFSKKYFMKVTDHSVTQEEFELYHDEELDMLITHPQPNSIQIEKYYQSDNYISHTDSKATFFDKTYQFVKQIAILRKTKLLKTYCSKTGKILDIGAGTGDFLVSAKLNGWDVFGIEPNSKAKEIAKKKGVSFVENTTVFENNYFDIITMWHVLEHVPNLETQIIELKRVLKKNGILIIAVPNFKSYDAKYYQRYWAAFDVPIHFWHFSKKAIEIIFNKFQFQLLTIKPMKFDAFYVSLLSEKYKTGKMNYIKAFYIGCMSNWKAKSKMEYSSHIYILRNN